LAKAAGSGAKWVAFSQATRLAAQMLGIVILARLLSPSDFGVVAMASVVTGFAHIFRDFGTVAAVIQRRELEPVLLNSIFWLNVLLGTLIALILVALAPAVALLMHEPQLTQVLWLLALAFPIVSIGLVQQALFERASRFRPVALIECSAAFVGLGTAVVAALAGWGVYSLVSQTIVSATVTTLGLWSASTWRPGRQLSIAHIRGLWKFSGNLVGFNIFNYFTRNADSILIGRFLGATDLGFYNVAYRLMLWPLQNISWVAGRALFPALSRIQHDRQRLTQAYVRAAAAVFLITAPLTMGLFVLREPFVMAVLGESWRTVSDLLFWLAPVAVLQSVGTTVGWLYLSTGRTDVMFKVSVVYGLAAVSAFLIGLQWGVEGVAAAYCISSLVLFWPAVAIPLRLVGLGLVRFLGHLAPTLFAACLMALLVVVAARESADSVIPLWERLILLVAFGAATYFVVSLFIQRKVLDDVRSALLSR
jgi:PST family polysaccharide transporter